MSLYAFCVVVCVLMSVRRGCLRLKRAVLERALQIATLTRRRQIDMSVTLRRYWLFAAVRACICASVAKNLATIFYLHVYALIN